MAAKTILGQSLPPEPQRHKPVNTIFAQPVPPAPPKYKPRFLAPSERPQPSARQLANNRDQVAAEIMKRGANILDNIELLDGALKGAKPADLLRQIQTREPIEYHESFYH